MAKFWLRAAIGLYLLQFCLAEIGKCLMNEMPRARRLAAHVADNRRSEKLLPAGQPPARTPQLAGVLLALSQATAIQQCRVWFLRAVHAGARGWAYIGGRWRSIPQQLGRK